MIKEITPRIIKTLVEYELKIPNIGVKTKTNRMVFARYVCVALCGVFTKASSHEIGIALKRDHATVLHARQEFDKLIETKEFEKYKQAYLRLFKVLSMSNRNPLMFQTPEEIEQKYRIRLIKIIDKNHRVINNLLPIKESIALKKIAELPREDVEEFERMANVFYKRKISEKMYA